MHAGVRSDERASGSSCASRTNWCAASQSRLDLLFSHDKVFVTLILPHVGLTVAEYFRDAEGQDVLLFVDNIFRFTQVPAAW